MLEANKLQLEAELVTVRTRHLIKHWKLYTRLYGVVKRRPEYVDSIKFALKSKRRKSCNPLHGIFETNSWLF
jgi:hypothetical protein